MTKIVAEDDTLDGLSAMAARLPEPDPIPMDDAVTATGPTAEDLKPILSVFFGGLGAMLAARFNVPPLDPREIDMLAAPGAELLKLYDFTPKDPKIAAWIVMGGAMVAVVAPRAGAYQAARRAAMERKADNHDDDAEAAGAA